MGDGQWLHGSIPAFMSARWPNLRTLDLYDNNLRGGIPTEIGSMSSLAFVQLQGNRLSGIVPSTLFHSPRVEVNLQHNPGLHGCLNGIDEVATTRGELVSNRSWPLTVETNAYG